ncbi:MAG: NUDIX domain-containing protein [Hyphomicrobiaceae bacterium]
MTTSISQWLIRKAMQRYWRMTRAITLGAQGMVIDRESRVLLVRHSYRPGWFFPGGGVEKGETLRTALKRELREEAGIELTAEPRLFGVYANFDVFPSDHVALFVIRDWQQRAVPRPNLEIAEQGFFDVSALPADTSEKVHRRLDEVLSAAPCTENW